MITNSSLERYYSAIISGAGVGERRLNVPTIEEAAKDLELVTPLVYTS